MCPDWKNVKHTYSFEKILSLIILAENVFFELILSTIYFARLFILGLTPEMLQMLDRNPALQEMIRNLDFGEILKGKRLKIPECQATPTQDGVS